jgi:hypothetical protein
MQMSIAVQVSQPNPGYRSKAKLLTAVGKLARAIAIIQRNNKRLRQCWMFIIDLKCLSSYCRTF